jgi:hypothetical protein
MPTQAIPTMHLQGISSGAISPRMATSEAAASRLGHNPGHKLGHNSGRSAKAAREFEAQLIGSVLESLEKTFAAVPGNDSVPGSDDYNYLGIQALAGDLADRGGFGIGAMISHYLDAHEGTVAPAAISPKLPEEPNPVENL